MQVRYIGAVSAALLAASAFAVPVQAQPVNLLQAKQLGQSIASAAASAERTAPAGAIQTAVQGAVQAAIISAAAEPRVVLAAFDQVGAACRSPTSRDPEWTCPGSAEALRALASVRSIVIAQIEQTDPAALDTPGSAAFGSVPSTSAGGSNYRSL